MRWKNCVAGVILLSMVFIVTACGNPLKSINTSPSTTSTTSSTSAQPPQGERVPMPSMDFTAAAAKLGLTEQQLRDALGSDTQKPPDFATAAAKLGVTEEALREALGFQGGDFLVGTPPTGVPPAGIPPTDFPPMGRPPTVTTTTTNP